MRLTILPAIALLRIGASVMRDLPIRCVGTGTSARPEAVPPRPGELPLCEPSPRGTVRKETS